MWIYYCILIMLYLNSYIKNRLYLKVSLILLGIFLSFSYFNGVDWIHYERVYTTFPNFIELVSNPLKLNKLIKYGKTYEFMYYVYESIFKIIVKDFDLYKGITLLSFYICIHKNLNVSLKLKPFIMMALFSQLLPIFFEPLFRQVLAILVSFFVVKLLKEYKYLKAFLIVLLGSTFHLSLLIFLLFIPFLKLKLTNVKICTHILIIFLIFDRNIILLLLKFLPFLQGFEYRVDNVYNLDLLESLKRLLKILIFFIPFFYIKNDKKNIVNTKLGIFYLYLMILMIKIPTLSRIEFYFIFYFWEIIVIFINSRKKIKIKLLFLMLLYSIVSTRSTIKVWMKTDPYRYIPYQNYILIKIFKEKQLSSLEKINLRKKVRNIK